MRLQRFSEHEIGHPRALLFTIANNLAISYMTKSRSEREVIQSDDGMEDVPDTAIAPLRAVELEQARVQMERALATLSWRVREAWVLRHVEEMSYDDIAETLGITVHAVEKRLRQATLRLRHRLTCWGIDDIESP